MSKIEVDTIDTQSSTTLQVGSTNTALIKIGTSGDTVEYPAGTTFTQSGTQNVTAGGVINVKSGGNITIDSGATITNNGTASGFSADLTNLNATNLTSGTVPGARFPATLPAANGSALTNLNATALTSGTIPAARISSLPAGVGGKVLQVVTATHSTTVTQTANSYATSGLSAAITPASTSNKVLVLTSSIVHTFADGQNSSGRRAIVGLFRGTVSDTKLQEHYSGMNVASGTTSTFPQSWNTIAFSHLDSPSTTSAQTYTVGISGDGACDIAAQPDSDMSTITLLEIAG